MDRFVFTVEPWVNYGAHGGIEKSMTIRVDVDGEQHVMQRVLSNQRPFETEVEYYTRMAVATLHEKLKELDEAKGE